MTDGTCIICGQRPKAPTKGVCYHCDHLHRRSQHGDRSGRSGHRETRRCRPKDIDAEVQRRILIYQAMVLREEPLAP